MCISNVLFTLASTPVFIVAHAACYLKLLMIGNVIGLLEHELVDIFIL